MRAVFRHELSSYFTNVTAYVFGAFLLLFAGIYTMVYNLKLALTNFEYVLGGMSFVFLVIVPILTMRVLAEERRQKTDQLLYSLPLSMTRVILGKYAALFVVLLVPVAVISLYPLVLSAFGSVYLPAAYSTIVGFLLLGAALIAIGMFISSVTDSQAVAAGICFVVMLLNYFLSSLASYVSTSAFTAFVAGTVLIVALAAVLYWMTKSAPACVLVGVVLEAALVVTYVLTGTSFEGVFPEIMEQLSLFERFYNFVDGIFDVTSVVYFLTVIGVFLFLSVQSMEKRRWSE
jgi:ABC-2 type transport system permease protein